MRVPSDLTKQRSPLLPHPTVQIEGQYTSWSDEMIGFFLKEKKKIKGGMKGKANESMTKSRACDKSHRIMAPQEEQRLKS